MVIIILIKGNMKFSPFSLEDMLKIAKTSEDIEILINAYFNFIGHKNLYENSIVDKIMRKSVKLQNFKYLH